MNWKQVFSASSLIAFGLTLPANAQTATSETQIVANNTPRFVSTATNLGRANAAETMEVTVWLKPRNGGELDSLAEELYDPASSKYHNWLKPADIVSRFAPGAEQVAAVRKFFLAHNLAVVAVGPANFSVRGRGTLAAVEKAFRVEIHNFDLNGETYRANTADPYLDGPVAAMVSSVSGLDNAQYTHPVTKVSSAPEQQTTDSFQPAAMAQAASGFIASNCFTGPSTESFSGSENCLRFPIFRPSHLCRQHL
jgi:subtilase family serine protease